MPITYGTIGTNWITDSWISAAQQSGRWRLGAIYSRTQPQAESFGAKHDCANLHTSLSELAADASLQAIYVASPNSLHHAQAKQMLQAGKHVILEKPATPTKRELDDLFTTARQHGVILLEAFRHIQEANYRLLQRLLRDERRLGTVYGASLTYASYSSRYDAVLAGEEPNIFSRTFAGGSLVDIGVYPVAFAVGLFGRPESATYAPFICATGVDAGGVIILRYDGFGVQINNSKAYVSNAPCEVYGENGTITINATTDINTVSLWSSKTKQKEEFAGRCLEVQKPNVNMQEECGEFARIIEDGDGDEVARLEELSRIVIEITEDLRKQNGIVYPSDDQ